MCSLYESILSLCTERGIKGGKMCADLGLSKSLLTDLKAGRKKGITADTAQKIADYFGVSVDRVLGKEKAPAPEGERETSDQDIPDENFIILSRNAKKLSPEKRKQLLDMAKIMFKEEFKD